jgi:FKBP-type peptidyl-prolyl cis-trans isomerase
MMSDWATVTFEGFTPDGIKVYDSHDMRAFNFRVGHYEVSKCWDIAIQQMKPGEVSMITCPGILDQGGNIDQYIDSSSAWLPTY